MIPKDLQYSYKKVIGFTKQQKNAFKVLEQHNVNVNQFIRAAIADKLKREWKSIKENKKKEYCPF
jgi:hypothetical protein